MLVNCHFYFLVFFLWVSDKDCVADYHLSLGGSVGGSPVVFPATPALYYVKKEYFFNFFEEMFLWKCNQGSTHTIFPFLLDNAGL